MPGAFAEGPRAGGAEAAQFNPAMFGDILGGPRIATGVVLNNGQRIVAQVPAFVRGGFRIADYESPRPTDRVFFTYNHYNRVDTGTDQLNFDLNRETIGFEKTFFNDNASFGMRYPFLQLSGNRGDLDGNPDGDLSMVLKWAFRNNRATGNIAAVGIVITVPTGDDFFSINTGENLHSTVVQPFVSFIRNRDRFFLQGFSSVAVPTNSDDATIFLNDVGVGYWLYQCLDQRFLTGVVPTLEAHVATPLNHRGSNSVPVGMPDWVVLTGGVNFLIGQRSTLGLAVGTPVTGPRPFDLEGVVTFNFRF
jgi:hypothetical protein